MRDKKNIKKTAATVIDEVIQATAKVWLSGDKNKNKKTRPTVQIPSSLVKKYRMDKPCRIAFFDSGDGIKMKFVHLNHYD